MTLTGFLLSRIAQDAEWAQEALDFSAGIGTTREWRWVRFYGRGSQAFYEGAPHPARVLAECEAKRRIVALHGGDHVCWQPDYPVVGDFSETNTNGDCATIRYLAMAYATHADYRPEWAIGAPPVAGGA